MIFGSHQMEEVETVSNCFAVALYTSVSHAETKQAIINLII